MIDIVGNRESKNCKKQRTYRNMNAEDEVDFNIPGTTIPYLAPEQQEGQHYGRSVDCSDL